MALRECIIYKGLQAEDALPFMARQGIDPGSAYFKALHTELHNLFIASKTENVDRELYLALWNMGHTSFLAYENYNGPPLRETLLDPDMLNIELAVEAFFTNQWHSLEQ